MSNHISFQAVCWGPGCIIWSFPLSWGIVECILICFLVLSLPYYVFFFSLLFWVKDNYLKKFFFPYHNKIARMKYGEKLPGSLEDMMDTSRCSDVFSASCKRRWSRCTDRSLCPAAHLLPTRCWVPWTEMEHILTAFLSGHQKSVLLLMQLMDGVEENAVRYYLSLIAISLRCPILCLSAPQLFQTATRVFWKTYYFIDRPVFPHAS